MICIRKLAWYATAILLFAFAAASASADNKSFSIQVPATLPVKSTSFTFDVTFNNNANGNSTFNSIELDWSSSNLAVSDAVLKGTAIHGTLGAGSALFTGLSPVKTGRSVVVTLTATSSASNCTSSQVMWSARAFTGSPAQPSSPFTLTPVPPATTIDPACILGFVYQPGAAQAGSVITSAPSNPNGQPVGVGRFQGTTLDTTFNGPVTLAIKAGTGTAGATLSGTSASYSNGVATFPNLSIDRIGSGYVLTAASGTMSVDSNAFSIYGGTLGCAVPPNTNDNYDSSNGSTDFALDPLQDGTFGSSPTGGWGLRRGPNLDGAPCVKVDYTFNLDGVNLVASLLWDKSTGQQAAFEYAIVWPMVSVDASTGWAGAHPAVSWGVANPRAGTSDYVPAMACLGDVLADGSALLPTIPNAPPFNDPSIYPPATYPQYQPGQPAKLCIAQQGFTSMGKDGAGNAIVQYWDKVIDEGDGWVNFNP